MIEALSVVGNEVGTEDKPVVKMSVESFRSTMTTLGKENGENLLEHNIEEIITDSKLVHDDYIMIEDFAKYLMSK